LQSYLKEHKRLPLETVLAVLRQILEALEYAHGEHVIHRDLKPANLIIDPGRGRVRILDFGLAIIDEYDHQGQVTAAGADPLGSLLYMAPEQLLGQMLTDACDIYAVGLIVWEMLTGRAVFDGKTRSEMMFDKVTRTEGFALEETQLSLPPGLRSFVVAATRPRALARPSARDGLALC